MSGALPEGEDPCVYGCIYCEGGCGECVNCHGCECDSQPQSGRLFAVADGIRDREAFRSLLARLGIDAHVTTDDGAPTIALDRAGMEQLRDWFAEHGDAAQADAIQRALNA